MINLKKALPLIIVGIIVVIVLGKLFSAKNPTQKILTPPSPTSQQSENPQLLSTSPSPLDQATILPIQVLEFIFNQPLVNVPEVKWTLEPKADLQATISDDRKTFKLTPQKPFTLGVLYTLTIKADTKFESKKFLDHDLQYHFKTIEYKGV